MPQAVTAYIGLGANLGQPAAQIEAALAQLAAQPGLRLIARSRLYRSDPLGPAGQPDYCNAACAVESTLAPAPLMSLLQGMEDAAGRERTPQRWTARTLDLDLLHIEGVTLDGPSLRLPHPQLRHRAFVLIPLAEIAPALDIPGVGRVDALAARIDRSGLGSWA